MVLNDLKMVYKRFPDTNEQTPSYSYRVRESVGKSLSY